MPWNILNVQLLLEVSPLILYVCVLWSKGLLVPFLPYFCFKVREMPTIIEYSLSCLFQCFSPSPHLLFSSWFTHQQTHNLHILVYIVTDIIIQTHSNTVTHTISFFLSLLVFCVYIISLVKLYSESHSHSRSVPIYTSSSFSLHQYSTLFYLLSLIIIKCSFSFSSLDITLYFLFQEKLLLFSFQWIINKINVWMSFLLSTVFFHVFSTLVTQVSIPGGF